MSAEGGVARVRRAAPQRGGTARTGAAGPTERCPAADRARGDRPRAAPPAPRVPPALDRARGLVPRLRDQLRRTSLPGLQADRLARRGGPPGAGSPGPAAA